ncbi:hypothetical protein B0T24DRAFT_645113 [Lasiosphaeria ovina]|uniref:Uncharacterized protein n=1 Tax=Lasiosphaeria ovina TaxID=92902 RepID=A0AAE0NIW0_9PEZI|nr:hypothetical protein B0T24DRAFT_645113 [Lasiosphaeria ovina]
MAAITSRPPPAVSPSVTSASVSASSATTYYTYLSRIDAIGQPPTFQFTNVQDLFDEIDRTRGDSLTYTNYLEREKREKRWNHIGSARRSAQQGQSGGKEGDSAGGPNPQRAATGAWPTLVIEAGFSQTLGELRLGIRRWFSMSNHEVKIVLLAKFDEMPVRPGATTTRRSLQHQTPVRRQSITITRNATTNPISYNVTRGALVLSFRLLFLRDPGPGEGDLVFSVQELEKYARNVWAHV